jgi:ribosomal-protein-alanine N-acetyltransferase
MKLRTERLDLVAATLDHICAELEAPRYLASLLGATVDPGWPPGEYDRGVQEFFRDRLREGGADAVGRYGWYAVRRGGDGNRAVLVGAGGYIGPPDADGAIEVGFSLMPAWRNMGYATEMVEALVAHALADSGVRVIVAHTSMENPASMRVLEKSGFMRADDDGEGGVRYEIGDTRTSVRRDGPVEG